MKPGYKSGASAIAIVCALAAIGGSKAVAAEAASGPAAAAAIGVGANVILRLIMAARYGHRPGSVLLHPVAVILMMGVLLDSFRWSRRGDIRWRGRSYPARAEREAA